MCHVLLFHGVFLSNIHPFFWDEWPSRHQQLHLSSKCTNGNIYFKNVGVLGAFFYILFCLILPSIGDSKWPICRFMRDVQANTYNCPVLWIGLWPLNHLFFSVSGMTGTRQNLKSSSQLWQKMYPRKVCVSASRKKRYEHTLKGSTELKTVRIICVEQWGACSWVFPQGGPLDGSHTHMYTHMHTLAPHGPNYASSGALLTLPPKYRSKDNLPSPAPPTS